MHNWHQDGIVGMKSLIGVDQYYMLYRFGLAMAAAGREKDPPIGAPRGDTEDNPTTLSYTDADEKIINDALKRIGKEYKQMTPRRSREPDDTYNVSPVNNPGPIRRKS